MKPVSHFLGILSIVGLAGCASTSEPTQPPAAMPAATSLRPDQDQSGDRIYRTPNIDLRRYTRSIVEPVRVYRAPTRATAL